MTQDTNQPELGQQDPPEQDPPQDSPEQDPPQDSPEQDPPQDSPEQDKAAEIRPAGDPTGYALYSVTEQRFVGGVQSTKAKANPKDNPRKRKGHKYEVRQV